MSVRRRDWRETVQVATDLALLGLLVTVAAAPVVTAGAAVAAGSAAVHHYLEYDSWPGPGFCWSVFRRRLVSGFAVSAACGVALTLVVIDILALRAGTVPGGRPLMVLTVVVAAVAAGYVGLVVVAAGAADSARLRSLGSASALVADAAGLRSASLDESVAGPPDVVGRRPATIAAAAGVVALAGVLVMLVHPVLSPVLAGYTLFALHVVARRPHVVARRLPVVARRRLPVVARRRPSPHPVDERVGGAPAGVRLGR